MQDAQDVINSKEDKEKKMRKETKNLFFVETIIPVDAQSCGHQFTREFL